MHTPPDVKDDLLRNDSNEPDIDRAYERLRALHKSKVLPYYELMRSRTHGDIRYILVELNDKFGTILITNLVTNQINKYTNELNTDHESNITNAGEVLR